MKINKILIILIIALMLFVGNDPLESEVVSYDYTGEIIRYRVEPVGKSECKNLGTVDLKGLKASLVTLKSRILIVDVMENIFYNPENFLPYKTERTNSGLWIKDVRIEEYDQNKFTVLIKKFRNKKPVKELLIRANGPIQNMNTLLFYLRKQPDLKIGWHFAAKVLNELKLVEYDLKLLSIEEITVPGGTFQAYHFKSTPDTFEFWIDKSSQRIPVKIKIKGIVNCSLLMQGYKIKK